MDLRKCLITGGCGFVGSSLALHLRQNLSGLRIIALDNFYRRGARLNIPRLQAAGIEIREGDVRDERIWQDLPPCDLVIDAAAEPSVMAGSTGSGVEYVVGTNLVGTLNLLEWCRIRGGRLIFLSSSRVYPVGALRAIPLRETADRLELDSTRPFSGVSEYGIGRGFPMEGARTLYGATKYASEVMVGEYAEQFGLDAVIDRCSVLAGPWQMGRTDQGIVALWAARHVFQRPLSYLGYGGRQVRDILHIQDFADLILRQARHPISLTGHLYLIGGGRDRAIGLRELTRLCAQDSGNAVPISEDPVVRPGDAPWIVLDSRATEEAFGWHPRYSVADTVRDTVRWIASNRSLLAEVLDHEVKEASK